MVAVTVTSTCAGLGEAIVIGTSCSNVLELNLPDISIRVSFLRPDRLATSLRSRASCAVASR